MFGWLFGSKAQLRLNGQILDDEKIKKNIMGLIFITSKQLCELIIEHIPERIIFSKIMNAKNLFFLTLSFKAAEIFYALNAEFKAPEDYIEKIKNLCKSEFQNIKYPGGWSWTPEEADKFIQTASQYQYLISKEAGIENSGQLSPKSFSILLTESLLSLYNVELDDHINVQRLLLEMKISASTGANIGSIMKQNGLEYS